MKGGRGANCGFFIGENEVLVIDAKMNKESAKALISEIKKIFNVEDRPPRPGRRRWLSLVETIYLELTEKK